MRISDWSSDVCSSDLGKVGGGLPPGTITEDFEKIDRHGTWLKRPPFDYTPTAFDRFWVPNETLLQEWVRRSIKEVLIPIPGTSKSITCSVVLRRSAALATSPIRTCRTWKRARASHRTCRSSPNCRRTRTRWPSHRARTDPQVRWRSGRGRANDEGPLAAGLRRVLRGPAPPARLNPLVSRVPASLRVFSGPQ